MVWEIPFLWLLCQQHQPVKSWATMSALSLTPQTFTVGGCWGSLIFACVSVKLKLVQFHRCCLLLLELPWDFILTSVFLWWPVVNLWWWTNICWVIWQTWAYGLQSWKIKSYIIMVPFKRLKGSLKSSRAFTGKSF